MNIRKKLKNHGLWMAVISSIVMIMQALGVGIDIPLLQEALIGLCGVLVTLGIISDPSKGKGFKDE